MQFRRSGQRDERRRRVLMEEALAASDGEAAAATPRASRSAAAAGRRYSDAARPERQPRVTDLVPLRRWTLTVLLLALLSIPAALIGLDGEVGGWSRTVGRANLAALDLDARGSLASWFGSLLLSAAAAGSVLIFLLRRHKVDDYRGRYRFWLWAAAVLVLGSIDATTGLRHVFSGLLARTTGWLAAGDGAAWSLILGAVLFGTLALRGAIEIRHSRGALAALLLAVTAYSAGAAAFAHWLPLPGPLATLAGHAALLLGHVLVLYCVLVFARHVLLDAQGKLPHRAAKAKRKQRGAAPESGAVAGRKLRVDAAHAPSDEPDPPAKPTSFAVQAGAAKFGASISAGVRPNSPTSPLDEDDDLDTDESLDSDRHLSKAERRRLRKLQKRSSRD
jgi:hypothetical protein